MEELSAEDKNVLSGGALIAVNHKLYARPSYEYRVPLVYVEPIAELEAAGYTPT